MSHFGNGDFRLCSIGEFWLGLKKIFSIARQGDSRLRLQIEDWQKEKHSMEFQYTLEGPASNYTIRLRPVDHTSETDFQAGMRFSTKDRNDGNYGEHCGHDYTGTAALAL